MAKEPQTTADIVEQIAKKRLVENTINAYTINARLFVKEEDKEEIAQEIYLDYLEKPFDKLKKVWDAGNIKYYVFRTVRNQISSKNGKYRREFGDLRKIKTIDIENIKYKI